MGQTHISKHLLEPDIASKALDSFESEILRLEIFPYRYSEREIGSFARKGYRQLFVKNYTVIFRIVERTKQVIIVTIRYSPSNF